MLDPAVIRSMDFGGGNACSVEEYVWLAALVFLQKPRTVLEIGTSTGIGALVMAAAGNADGHACRVTTVDIPFGASTFASGLAANLARADQARPGTSAAIAFVTGDAREVLPRLAGEGHRFDLIFIDGDHSEGGVEADWQHALELEPDTVVLHDSVHHQSVARLVERLGADFGGLTLTYPPGWQGSTGISDVGFATGQAGGPGRDCPGLTVFTRVAQVAAARARFLREHVPSGHEVAQRLQSQGVLAPAHLDRVYDGFGFRQAMVAAPLAGSDRILEIVLTGRNDGFGGDDFTDRMLTAASFNHRNLTEAGLAHRFTLVEWNPSPGRPLLADIIRARLPWWGDCLVVDPAWHQKLSENPRLEFMEFFAKNVGIRRSTADWILTSNTDIFFSREVVERIARGRLVPGTLYRACRIDLDRHIPWREPSWSLFEQPRHHLRTHGLEPPYFSNAAGDFLLLDRAAYHRLGGFNERVRFAKIYKDGQFCIQAHAHGMPIDVLGPIHHLDHEGSFITATEKYGPNHELAPFGPRWDASQTYANRHDWGLTAAVETADPAHACLRLHLPETHGPALSIVMPGHAVPAWFRAAVDRLLAASAAIEVVVAAAAPECQAAWDGPPPPRVRFVGTEIAAADSPRERPRAGPPARALNLALAAARGRLLAIASTPAALSAGGIERLLARFEAQPGLDALSCAYRWVLPDGSAAGAPSPADRSPFFVFRRRVYDALEALDEVAPAAHAEFWLRIAATHVVDAEASIVFEVWPRAGEAPWLTQVHADEDWAARRLGSPAGGVLEAIPGHLVADYARRKQVLRESLRAQLAARLPEGARSIAVWEVDATTPVLVQAAHDLGLAIESIFTRHAWLEHLQIGGVPVRSPSRDPLPDGIPVVLTMPSLVDRAAIYRRFPSSAIVPLVSPGEGDGGVPFPLEAWSPLAEARGHRRAGRSTEALQAYRVATGLDPGPHALQEAADAAIEVGDLRAAIGLLRRLLRLRIEPDWAATYQLASLFKRRGQAAQARRFFGRLAGRDDVPAHFAGGAAFHLGELSRWEGDTAAAERWLRRALAILPGHARAAEELAAIGANGPHRPASSSG